MTRENRWAWGPVALALLVTGVGPLVRWTLGPIGLVVAVAVLGAVVVALAVSVAKGRPVGSIDRGEEVAYAALVLTSAGVWTVAVAYGSWRFGAGTAAAAVGAGAAWAMLALRQSRPVAAALGLLVGAGAVVLAIEGTGSLFRWPVAWLVAVAAAAAPWWSHRRIRRRVKVDKAVGSFLISANRYAGALRLVPGTVNAAPDSWSAKVEFGGGLTARALAAAVERIESAEGMRPGAMTVEADPHRRDRAIVTVVATDPHKTAATYPGTDAVRSIVDPVPFAMHDDGQRLDLTIWTGSGTRHGLWGGATDMGKSTGLRTAMTGWTAAPDVVFWMIDMSGGVAARPWLPCLDWCTSDPDAAVDMLHAAQYVVTARGAELAASGREFWTPTPGQPAIVLLVDEAPNLLTDQSVGRSAEAALVDLGQRARKVALSVQVIAQRPNRNAGVSPSLRSQMALRICFGLNAESDARYILDGVQAGTVSPIEFRRKGQVLVASADVSPVPGRTFLVDQDTAANVADRHAARRPQLDAASARAAGPAYAQRSRVLMVSEPVSPRELPTGHGDVDTAELEELEEGDGPAPTPYWRDAVAERMDTVGFVPPARRPRQQLTTEDAAAVVLRLLADPSGTSPAEVVKVTGRSRRWAHNFLTGAEGSGRVERIGHGQYRLAEPANA